MRTLNTSELDRVAGGRLSIRQAGGGGMKTDIISPPNAPMPSLLDPIDPAYWENDFAGQVGVAPPSSGPVGGGGVTLTPAESEGLTDVEAAKLIGWIEALGAFTDPATALESDDGITGFSAVELEKTTMAMKMYCTDHGQGWAPGPTGSPGVCTQ